MAVRPPSPEVPRGTRAAEDRGRIAHEPVTGTGSVPPPEASPGELVARMAGRDEAALSELYDRFSGRVYALILRILDDEADAGEVLLEVFTRAWRRAADYDRARSTVATWLSVMARSNAIDALRARRSRRDWIRRARRTTPHHPPAMGQRPADLGADAERREMRRHIDEALGSLNADQRHAIELAYFQGLSQSQIADLLEAPLGTIKTRIRTGMRRLRDLLEPLYADEAG